MAIYRIGDLTAFSYRGKHSNDLYPQVLILHDKWSRRNFPNEVPKVHGLNWNMLSDQEINHVKALMNPKFAQEIVKTDPIIRQNLTTIGYFSRPKNLYNVESPYDFYIFAIKPFITRFDSYRLYFPEKMMNIRVVTRREELVGQMDQQKSMFQSYLDKVKNFGRSNK